MNWRTLMPWILVCLRVVLCPLIIFGGYCGWDGRSLSLIVIVALVDDIYDGVLARRWNCDTARLRRADSAADTVFYLGVAWTLFLRVPQLLRDNGPLLLVLATLELARHIFDRVKFGKAASYHSYFAKMWGLVLAIGVSSELSFGGPAWLITTSVLFGIAADLEGLIISILLPAWRNDVRTVQAARRLRQSIFKERPAPASNGLSLEIAKGHVVPETPD